MQMELFGAVSMLWIIVMVVMLVLMVMIMLMSTTPIFLMNMATYGLRPSKWIAIALVS